MEKSLLNVRVFLGRMILTIGEEFHEVELFFDDKKLKKGYGYISGNYVFIYRGRLTKYKNKKELDMGIYLDDSKTPEEYMFVQPKTKEECSKYNIDNVIELNLEKIFYDIQSHKDEFIDPEDIEIINNNSEIYIPTIKEDDDFLKYIVKKVIMMKKINLKNYKGRFSNPYALNNLKSGLKSNTKMSVPNFKLWEEILGFKWEMKIFDAGEDKTNPLPEDFNLKSEDF